MVNFDDGIALLKKHFAVDAVWLFGSQARGEANEASDVDIAALLKTPPSAQALLDARAELALLFGRDVDLVDLWRASPIVQMQVLKTGKLLFEGDPCQRIAFAAGVSGRYEDLKRVRKTAESALLARIRG